jgi:hypothetical protein
MHNRNAQSDGVTMRIADSFGRAVDQMTRWPIEMTGATWDLMLQGVQRMTRTFDEDVVPGMEEFSERGITGGGRGSGGRSSASYSASSGYRSQGAGNGYTGRSSSQSTPQSGSQTTSDDQDLSGDDLKYVTWSIVFTKPGYECVLEPLHADLVSYSGDGSSFAAIRIAEYLEKARQGQASKPETWGDRYPTEHKTSVHRTGSSVTVETGYQTAQGTAASADQDRGWKVPVEDHKYIQFLYKVERRIPKPEEPTHVEHIIVESHGTTVS